ncbi:hypothetical protein F4810DRAFT_645071, partial [Camillea tinctor]
MHSRKERKNERMHLLTRIVLLFFYRGAVPISHFPRQVYVSFFFFLFFPLFRYYPPSFVSPVTLGTFTTFLVKMNIAVVQCACVLLLIRRIEVRLCFGLKRGAVNIKV